MKTIILIAFILSNMAFAKDYICETNGYRIELDLHDDRSTHIWERDAYRYNLITQAYAGSIDRGQIASSFYFYGQTEPTVLSFKNEDIKNKPNKIKGHIEAMFEGFYFTRYMTCIAR